MSPIIGGLFNDANCSNSVVVSDGVRIERNYGASGCPSRLQFVNGIDFSNFNNDYSRLVIKGYWGGSPNSHTRCLFKLL